MGYYYIPGTNKGGDPWRALRLLVQTLLIASGIGIVILIVRKILGK